jgi:hypothetical protein
MNDIPRSLCHRRHFLRCYISSLNAHPSGLCIKGFHIQTQDENLDDGLWRKKAIRVIARLRERKNQQGTCLPVGNRCRGRLAVIRERQSHHVNPSKSRTRLYSSPRSFRVFHSGKLRSLSGDRATRPPTNAPSKSYRPVSLFM